jgi:hypothetical protein
MHRLLLVAALVLAGAAAARADCAGTSETKHKFSNADKPDTFVVESFGPRCDDARVLIYVKSEPQAGARSTSACSATTAPSRNRPPRCKPR